MNLRAAIAGALLLFSGVALAEQNATAVMADILAGMNHFPSDEQKAMLADIAENDQVDAEQRAIAEAIANIEHQPTPEDREKLQAIVDDPEADEAEKTLAQAVLRFNHAAAEEDAAALQALSE